MFVSFYMTVRNGEDFLGETLSSILNQTYKKFELIIVDDNSSDSTPFILSEMQLKDKRVRVVSGGNGRAKSLNLALSLCRGDWVANIDCDDPISLDYLSEKVEIVTNENFSCLFNSVAIINSNGNIVSQKKVYSKGIVNKNKSLERANDLCHSSLFISKKAIDSVKGYDVGRDMHLDFDLYLRLIEKKVDIYQYDTVLSYKRVHDGQSFEAKRRFKYLASCFSLQFRYALSKKRYEAVPYLILKFIYGFFPSKIRSKLSSFIHG